MVTSRPSGLNIPTLGAGRSSGPRSPGLGGEGGPRRRDFEKRWPDCPGHTAIWIDTKSNPVRDDQAGFEDTCSIASAWDPTLKWGCSCDGGRAGRKNDTG